MSVIDRRLDDLKSESAPPRDDWTQFCLSLFPPDSFACPKAWEGLVASYLHRKGYDLQAVRAILEWGKCVGSYECCPAFTSQAHRVVCEAYLPDSPPAEWARHDDHVYAADILA